MLVDPTGTQGWAVGGYVSRQGEEAWTQTSDIERYPADGVTPVGESERKRWRSKCPPTPGWANRGT